MEAGKYIYVCGKLMRKLDGNIQVLRKREINPLKEYLTNTIFS
jgi:hypothetical protein